MYKNISRGLLEQLRDSDDKTLATSIAEVFTKYEVLPLSNQNFFKSFIQYLISELNNDFIVRYYNGTGAVLVPSHGIVQVLEKPDGSVITQTDLAKFATEDYHQNPMRYIGMMTNSNDEIINRYLELEFPTDKEVN
jgi:hypothetical protein